MKLDANGANYSSELRVLLASELDDATKLARAYGEVTRQIVVRARRDVELAVALGDPEEKIRQQIKLETMKTARAIFRGFYRQVTGTEAWDESPER
jgi:hypothetical protein